MIYFLFGTNAVIGPQIRDQLKVLNEILPPVFRHRAMDDLGCGDGKLTSLLKDVFAPKSLRGFDVSLSLVRRARARGIKAEVLDLERERSNGELAVMWGVLHHLKDRETCLKMIKENYALAFIREPIKNKWIRGLEMGTPLIRQEIESLVSKHMPAAQTFHYGHCIFIFYISPELQSAQPGLFP